MYRSKQACTIFTSGLAKFLTLSNFERLSSDACSFVLRSHSERSHFSILVITVEDFLVTSNILELLSKVKDQLRQKYKYKDLGRVEHIIGWKVTHTDAGIKITQLGYIKTVLDKFRLTDAKPTSSPIASELLAPHHYHF